MMSTIPKMRWIQPTWLRRTQGRFRRFLCGAHHTIRVIRPGRTIRQGSTQGHRPNAATLSPSPRPTSGCCRQVGRCNGCGTVFNWRRARRRRSLSEVALVTSDPHRGPTHQDHQREPDRRGGDHHRHHRIKSDQDHAETGSNTTPADVAPGRLTSSTADHRGSWNPAAGSLGPRVTMSRGLCGPRRECSVAAGWLLRSSESS